MRVLLDTNVVVAAFVSRGACAELFEHCARHHELVSSPPLVEELRRALEDLEISDAHRAVRLCQRRTIQAKPLPLAEPVSRDPDDDVVLATALAGECRCIVTEDKDLLVPRSFGGIEILRPREFWAFEASA